MILNTGLLKLLVEDPCTSILVEAPRGEKQNTCVAAQFNNTKGRGYKIKISQRKRIVMDPALMTIATLYEIRVVRVYSCPERPCNKRGRKPKKLEVE